MVHTLALVKWTRCYSIMPRYVILEHDHPVLHWDFMLEAGDVLRTWRLAERPELGRTIAAETLPDHRRVYLDYEGPVSGNRGYVTRWDVGSFTWFADEADRVIVQLQGGRFHSIINMEQTSEGRWKLTVLG